MICIRVGCFVEKLTINKIYKIIKINKEFEWVHIKGDDNEYCTFDINRFTTLKQIRKEKLIKIQNGWV